MKGERRGEEKEMKEDEKERKEGEPERGEEKERREGERKGEKEGRGKKARERGDHGEGKEGQNQRDTHQPPTDAGPQSGNRQAKRWDNDTRDSWKQCAQTKGEHRWNETDGSRPASRKVSPQPHGRRGNEPPAKHQGKECRAKAPPNHMCPCQEEGEPQSDK